MSGRRHAGADYPAWIREIVHTMAVKPQFLVTGNVHDHHALPDSPSLVPTVEVVVAALADAGYRLVLRFDVVDGVSIAHETEDGSAAAFVTGIGTGQGTRHGEGVTHKDLTIADLGTLLKAVARNTEGRVALIIDYASRVRVDDQDSNPAVHRLLTAATKLAESTRLPVANTIVWIADRESDLPHWLAASESVRVVSIPTPTLASRRAAVPSIAANLDGFVDLAEPARDKVLERFAKATHGMGLRDLDEIARLAMDEAIPATRIEDAVTGYRVGVVDNPWREKSTIGKILEAESILGKAVKGQERAVRKAADILTRAAAGLSGVHSGGHAGRPQGVLFLAGPTGVGKTELAKSLATLLFGTPDAYTRFDMSEFSAEQSEARLIGAPPGFVGHNSGGELTNAVRQRPFSILLFDEVEKAHPSILDKFLQILEDGRLTDGSGSTVYFNDTVIVFTSNLGIYRTVRDEHGHARREAVVEPGDADIETKVRDAIQQHFTLRLGRPELLNRIGTDNIVVFDFITEKVGRDILGDYLVNISDHFERTRGFTLSYSDAARATIERECLTEAALAFGGRGIGSALETVFINPLARAVFEITRADSTTDVVAVEPDGSGWKVELR